MQDIIEAAQYLQGVNIIKLQSAARLAGLRWKSGAPGYDKAGIIEKLQQSPSIMRATVSALRRMEGGNPAPAPSGPNPFAEALEDSEEFSPSPSPAPALAAPSNPIPGVSVDPQVFHGLTTRIQALEEKAPKWATFAQADDIARGHSLRMRDALMPHIEGLTNRVKELETRAPVQINIGEIKLPPISGQHERFPRMAKWLSARFHVLLIGPAGTGKTTAAIAYAEMMSLNIYAQPLCMDYTGVTGFITATGEVIETEFTRAWKTGGVLLWDELSMSAPDAVGALNSALANGFLALPGVGNVKAHPDFYLIAGDNSDTGASVQFNARTLLDGATLDRFIRIDWPVDLSLETNLAAGEASWLACVRAVRAFIAQRDIQHVGATSRAVIQGAKALKTGAFSRVEILEDTCKKGALATDWPKVLEIPAVRSFLQGA